MREYKPTEEDIKRMEKLVKVVWDKIINLDLPDIWGYTPDIACIRKFEDDLLSDK